MSDPKLMQLFLEEALTYQKSLGNSTSDARERLAAARALEHAADAAGADEIAGLAAEYASRLDSGTHAQLDSLQAELGRCLDDLESTLAADDGAASASSLDASLEHDSHTSFEHEELLLLHGVLRDEAQQILEHITQILLAAGAKGPSDATFDELMRAAHSLKGSASTVGLDLLANAAHALEDLFERVRSGRSTWSAHVADAFVDAVDSVRSYVDVLDDSSTRNDLGGRVNTTLSELARKLDAQSEQDLHPRLEFDEATVTEVIHREDSTSMVMQHIRERAAIDGGPERKAPDRQVLRIDANRIDRLMDSVGELVFDRTRIERRVQEIRSLAHELGFARQRLRDSLDEIRGQVTPGATRALEELETDLAEGVAHLSRTAASLLDDSEALRRTGTALEQGLTKVRMMSVGSLFELLAPQLRAIARAADKRVKLVTLGEDTEFDKAVAEQVTDPLIQLLRNAVAHGIENVADRIAAGKPEQGQISLRARHEGDSVVLEVADDGRGVDPEELRSRYVATGLWTSTRARLATDEEILRSIFDPGTTSRSQADTLSGRGVGLDSVRETLARLGGEIRVTSTPGKGTVFSLRLPLTTALSQALLFKVGGNVYAIPNVHVVETAYIEASELERPSDLVVRGHNVPLLNLHKVLGADIVATSRSVPVVIMSYASKRLAVTTDKIVGPREIVVKSLGSLLAPLPLFAGGTISGSGKVQLILDPAALARLAHAEEVAGGRMLGYGLDPERERPERVLVVDDSRAIREALVRILERGGYVVDVADQGARAWNMMRQVSYDALVTDLEMPVMSGFELIERVRADVELRPLRIVVISSRTSDENRIRAQRLGVATFLAKPVVSDALIAALRTDHGS